MFEFLSFAVLGTLATRKGYPLFLGCLGPILALGGLVLSVVAAIAFGWVELGDEPPNFWYFTPAYIGGFVVAGVVVVMLPNRLDDDDDDDDDDVPVRRVDLTGGSA